MQKSFFCNTAIVGFKIDNFMKAQCVFLVVHGVCTLSVHGVCTLCAYGVCTLCVHGVCTWCVYSMVCLYLVGI